MIFSQETVEALAAQADRELPEFVPRILEQDYPSPLVDPLLPSPPSPRSVIYQRDDFPPRFPSLEPSEYESDYLFTQTQSQDDASERTAPATPEPVTAADLEAQARQEELEKDNDPARAWIFTLNNWTEDEWQHLESFAESVARENWNIRYICYGQEVGEEGTPHLQGYVSFTKPCRFKRCKLVLGTQRVYLDSARGSGDENRTYCSKQDGVFREYGDIPTPGKRTDIERFVEHVRDNGMPNRFDMLESFAGIQARYPQFVDHVAAVYRPQPSVDPHPLYKWQAELYGLLMLAPDQRKIHFCVEGVGNTGKSWFCNYYQSLHPDSCAVLGPGQRRDLADAWSRLNGIRVVFIDCQRTMSEFMCYAFIEDLMNERMFTPKYRSHAFSFKRPHVVVMMNQTPDMNALSQDRYHIIVPNTDPIA